MFEAVNCSTAYYASKIMLYDEVTNIKPIMEQIRSLLDDAMALISTIQTPEQNNNRYLLLEEINLLLTINIKLNDIAPKVDDKIQLMVDKIKLLLIDERHLDRTVQKYIENQELLLLQVNKTQHLHEKIGAFFSLTTTNHLDNEQLQRIRTILQSSAELLSSSIINDALNKQELIHEIDKLITDPKKLKTANRPEIKSSSALKSLSIYAENRHSNPELSHQTTATPIEEQHLHTV